MGRAHPRVVPHVDDHALGVGAELYKLVFDCSKSREDLAREIRATREDDEGVGNAGSEYVRYLKMRNTGIAIALSSVAGNVSLPTPAA